MSKRIQNFNNMKSHPMLGKLFKKLTKSELEQLETFIKENDHLDVNQYAFVCNRWMLDKPKPRRFTDMWSIALQVNEKPLKQGEK